MSRRRAAWPASITFRRNWRRYLFPLIVLAVAGALSIGDRFNRKPTPGDDHATYHNRPFRVVRVVDGDTFDIAASDATTGKDMTRIRLWGVDTPEVKHGGAPDMYFGPEAKTFAERVLAGRNVYIVLAPNDTRGKYGRLLAYVYLGRGGGMFNEMLLEQGYAYADPRFEHPYRDRFETLEARARRAGIGLWAAVTPDDMPKWRRKYAEEAAGPGG